jgi:hypothetical protein
MSATDRQDLIIRAVSVALVPASVLLVRGGPLVFTMAIVLGQGHFLLAYLYQAEAGKLTRERIVYLIAAFFFLLWAIFTLPYTIASLLTALVFGVHFCLDEARLLNGRHTLFTTLEALPFFILYGGMYADMIFVRPSFFSATVCAALIAALVYRIVAQYAGQKAGKSAYAFAAWGVCAFGLYLAYHLIAPANTLTWFWFALMSMVLLHYYIWYGVYWYKLASAPQARRLYVARAVAINALLILLAFIWIEGPFPPLSFLFAPLFFNLWTYLHIIASFRSGEFKAAVRFAHA